ncbi:MAG: tetratricopeptide repeat protein [Ignavibacteriales bacterium]|nr:tetratricopeptide repeat protein [Ignavibacteriales bacterium]
MTPKEEADLLLIEGNDLFELSNFSNALEKYQEAIKKDPNYPSAFLNSGLAFLRLGKDKEAIDNFRKVLELEPNNKTAYRNLGIAYANLLDFDNAILNLEKALEINPLDSALYNDLGNAYLNSGKYELSITQYKKALEVDPNFIYAFYNWGLALEKMDKLSEAVEQYQKAIHLEPDYLNANKNLAGILLKLGNNSEAIDLYKKIIIKDPSAVNAYINLGKALLNLGKFEEAIKQYETAININPTDAIVAEDLSRLIPEIKTRNEFITRIQKKVDEADKAEVYNRWGNVFFDLRKYQLAIEQYKKAILCDKEFIYAHHNWGLALERQHLYSEAVPHFKDALIIDINYADSIKSLADCLFKLKDFANAEVEYKKLTNLDSQNVFSFINYANVLSKLNRFEEAFEQYKIASGIGLREALASDEFNLIITKIQDKKDGLKEIQEIVDRRSNAEVYNDWGNVYYSLMDYPNAIEQYYKSIQIDPKFVYAYHNLGLSYFNLKQYNRAIEEYKNAIEADKDYASTYYNYAFLLDRKGDYKSAYEIWEKASETYEKGKPSAIETKSAEHMLYYGDILHSVFQDYPNAEKIYKEGLKIDPEYIPILINLTSVYLDIKENTIGKDDESASARIKAHWNAWENFRMAEKLLLENLTNEDDYLSRLDLGDLYLMMGQYEKAKEVLKKAIEKDKDLARVHSKLAITYFRLEDYKKAIKNFEIAIDQDPDNLILQAGLAESYLKAEMIEKAEAGYKKILNTTPFNVESLIGLGEIYTQMADKEDTDLYPLAIDCHTKSLNYANSNKGSKKLKRSELSAVHYSRGYARVKYYESMKLSKDENVLMQAMEDFKLCYNNDPDNHKAKRAQEKIQKKFNYSSVHWLSEKFGPTAIFIFSFLFLLTVQWLYFVGKPVYGTGNFMLSNESIVELKRYDVPDELLTKLKLVLDKKFTSEEKLLTRIKLMISEQELEKFKPLIADVLEKENSLRIWQPIEVGYYGFLTFASLIFMITGLYLPQILKLKVGGIELEKSAVDQIKTNVTLGISKWK